MVHHPYVQQLCGGRYPRGQIIVGRRRMQLSRRMIVHKHYGRRLSVDHFLKQKSHIHHCGGHSSLAHHPPAFHSVGTVKHQHPELLMTQTLKPRTHHAVYPLARSNLRHIVRQRKRALATSPKFYGRHKGYGLGGADSRDKPRQFRRRHPRQARQIIAANRQNLTAHLHHRPPLQPRSEQYGNQFGRSERSRAVGPGFLARPVVIGKIAYELRAAHSCLF